MGLILSLGEKSWVFKQVPQWLNQGKIHQQLRVIKPNTFTKIQNQDNDQANR